MEENNEIFFENRIDLEALKNAVDKIKTQIGKVLVGQEEFLEFLIVSLLADGHVLIEGVPGVAKTVTAKMLAKTVATAFNRIQFTPDLMPSDVIGTSVLNMSSAEFEFKNGPIFSNLVLIDEINRAPAKTQSALFEVMEEKQITVDGITYKMPNPFMVLATQNPIEQEGTYALPEAQLDRFLFKILVDYPNTEDEIKILQLHNERKGQKQEALIESILTEKELEEAKSKVNDILVEEKLFTYIAEIISKTRNHSFLSLGGSPRASIAILQASKAYAAMKGRDFVIPEDIKKVVFPILRHRIMLTPEKEMEGLTTDKVIEIIVQSVEVPR
ncbi:AAA family ATPase [Aureivirga marina]|uniref:AAA family ATPase n=1 Tax=Aureivirga marina TaxID=1182451 RepID=UPI0018C8F4FC|nr:MoxR family ATPase [Aureivirga marina]